MALHSGGKGSSTPHLSVTACGPPGEMEATGKAMVAGADGREPSQQLGDSPFISGGTSGVYHTNSSLQTLTHSPNSNFSPHPPLQWLRCLW